LCGRASPCWGTPAYLVEEEPKKMCLHPRPVDSVPEQTARVARSAFPDGNPYMRMRDELGTIFEDDQFVGLFPERGKPAFSPWRLALVTIMQFSEDLSDRQAADAVRSRIDWKYALSLELDDPGFDASILCEFRTRLLENGEERLLFDALLERFRAMGLVKARGRQRTDSTHVLAAARNLERLELVGEAMRRALNAMAVAAPGWLRSRARPEWALRYARPFDDRWLPKGKEERREEAEQIGADGFELLVALLEGDAAPAWLKELPAVETMRMVWLQNYLLTAEGVRWRTKEEGLPPTAKRLATPTDPESRGARRGEISWGGYKIHLTETCDEGAPRIVTHVGTAPAPEQDAEAVSPTHEALAARDLLPALHLVDGAYMEPRSLLEAHERFGVNLVGPAMRNTGWQAREGNGFDLSSFELDWEKKEATCPEGKKSMSWKETTRDGRPAVRVRFSRRDCRPCPSRDQCIRREKSAPFRDLTIRSREHYEALRLARELGLGPDKSRYSGREGIEGTVSRTVRTCGARRARYVGLGKVHLQHLLGAAALNFLRVGECLQVSNGERRHAPRSPS
jgi:transposase